MSDVLGAPALPSLDATLRDVLVVLALSDAPALARSPWKEAVARAAIVDERGRQHTGEAFKAMCEATVACGATRIVAQHQYRVARAWLAPLLDDAHRRGALRRIVMQLGVVDRYSYSGRGIGAQGQLFVALATGERLADASAAFSSHLRFHRDPGQALIEAFGIDISRAWIDGLEPALRSTYVRTACDLAFIAAIPLGPGVRSAALASDRDRLSLEFLRNGAAKCHFVA